MNSSFFAPGFALIGRIGLRANFALGIALFILAQLIGACMLAVAKASAQADNAGFVASLFNALLEQSGTAVLMFVATLSAIYLFATAALWTTTGMDRMNKIIERVASGDLSGYAAAAEAAVATRSGDVQSGTLWQSLAQMTRNLVDIVNQVRTSADHIAHGAKEIAAGNTSLSQRTEEQASTLEETSASMEELAATVKQNAENCGRARAAADDASKITTEAATRMRELTQTMSQIEAHSRRVADITGVIEGIAFQTNILALNAAVEAARAGDVLPTIR